jgi:hypothetical protein
LGRLSIWSFYFLPQFAVEITLDARLRAVGALAGQRQRVAGQIAGFDQPRKQRVDDHHGLTP